MSDESEPDVASGLDLAAVSQRMARERASNSIRIRRSRFTQPMRTVSETPTEPTPSEDTLAVVANETETKFSPEGISEVFQSNDLTTMEHFCVELTQFISCHPDITIIKDPEIVELIISQVTFFSTPSAISHYLELITVMTPKHESEICSDLFFTLRDEIFPTFPSEVCEFFSIIPSISQEAKNSMLCLGIIQTLIDAFPDCEDENLAVEIIKAIHATLAVSCADDADSIRDFLPGLVQFLSSPNINAVYYVLLCLVEILAISASFISPLFRLNVNEILVDLIQNPQLAGPCIAISGSMAICSDDEIQGMIPLFEIEKSLIGGEYTGDVFWCLMNGLDSCPGAMMRFFDEDFINTMGSLLQDSPFGLMRDVACFAATLLVLAPADELKSIITHNILGPLIDMLDCGNPPIIVRCLDGLKKVVMLAFSDPSVIDNAPDLFQNDELPEVLSRLEQLDEQMVVSRATQLGSELEQLTAQSS